MLSKIIDNKTKQKAKKRPVFAKEVSEQEEFFSGPGINGVLGFSGLSL